MALKYFFEYRDTQNILFRAEIREEAYGGEPVEIRGYCELEYPEIEEIYTVVRGSGMRIVLEANTDLTLEDLYSEEEKTFAVSLKREGVVIFRGFIDPAGLFEDLVNDQWEVTLDCVDGLALLENLSYVDDDGFPFIGRASDLEVIDRCLRRTEVRNEAGESLLLETSINTRYRGLPITSDPIANAHSNQERFYRDDGETIASCREVLESTLRKYGGAICLVEDKWRIFSFYELVHLPTRMFYTYRGTQFISSQSTNYPVQEIGSHVNNAEVHWVNENQRKEIVPGVGAVKVNYEYGFVQSIFQNEFFNNDGTTGVISGWGVNAADIDVNLGEPGVIYVTQDNNDVMLQTLSTQSISQGDSLEMFYNYQMQTTPVPPNTTVNLTTLHRFNVRLRIVITDGANTYSYIDNEWVSGAQDFVVEYAPQFTLTDEQDLGRQIPEAPISGELSVQLLRITIKDFQTDINLTRFMKIIRFRLNVSTDENLQGESHTYQIAGKNTRVPEVIETIVGDNFSDVYNGALYESNAETNTQFWRSIFLPLDIAANEPILRILAEFIAIYRRSPSYKMIGDAFGYFPYMQIFEFDLIPGRKFMITSYRYDTRRNIISSEWVELRRGATFGLSYEFALDFGNTVSPTIRG